MWRSPFDVLHDGGGFVLGRRDTVPFRSVLVGFAVAVAGLHGGLLVDGRGPAVRRSGIEMLCRGVTMRPFGPLQRLDGVQSGTLGGFGAARGTG
jgi:hypothetical protein